MEKNNFDDIYLARWISGDLTPEELSAFKKSKYYLDYKKINEGALAFKSPSFDRQSSLSRLEKSLKNKEDKKIKKLNLKWVYSAAAVLIIALGVLYFNPSNSIYETQYGEQLVVDLPDNSKVYLNSKSELEFKKENWLDNRVLNFNGEAFFDVEKGETFKVLSNEGVVEVLGTEFNVVSREDYFEIKCHEGKVKVSSNDKKELATLTIGKAFRINKEELEYWDFKEMKPSWLNGESSYNNTPIVQVIKSLENQYNINIDYTLIEENKRFTGSFTHSDLELALKTVFNPLNISYLKSGENSIVLNSKK
ncbi:FecR family protein [uncultured Lacinutrix sp.]|uniref:FecR family protein n=1 Tax=uncultured Lacinutrix sp. TaxID=574032 RepID=UPI00261A71A3|nr:FecR family protein [uncultured Lacinutrix sp.]